MSERERAEPIWVDRNAALAIHDRQLAEHGGGVGIRNPGGLDSALARPMNKWGYGEDDLATLASAYAFGVARNHPFVDGNKRTAWVFARLFLARNGLVVRFEPRDAIAVMLAMAAGEIDENEMTRWLRQRLTS